MFKIYKIMYPAPHERYFLNKIDAFRMILIIFDTIKIWEL